VRSVLVLAPQDEPANFEGRLFRLLRLAAVFGRRCLYDNIWSKVTPRYTGFRSCFSDLHTRTTVARFPLRQLGFLVLHPFCNSGNAKIRQCYLGTVSFFRFRSCPRNSTP